MRHRFTIVAVSVLCTVFLWGFWQILCPETPSISQTNELVDDLPADVTSEPSESIDTSDEIEEIWLLRSYEGKVALFTSTDDLPEVIYPIYVNTLPSYDQDLLRDGIYLDDVEQVSQYIADFES